MHRWYRFAGLHDTNAGRLSGDALLCGIPQAKRAGFGVADVGPKVQVASDTPASPGMAKDGYHNTFAFPLPIFWRPYIGGETAGATGDDFARQDGQQSTVWKPAVGAVKTSAAKLFGEVGVRMIRWAGHQL